jgi:hypothetical protein
MGLFSLSDPKHTRPMTRPIPFALGLLFVLLPGLAAAQQGTITGTVTDAETEQPLPGATVQLLDGQAGTATDRDGEFRLRVAAGQYRLRVSFVGYQEETRNVTVEARSTTRVRFRLQPRREALGELVVTALGQERPQDELGASQSTIDGAAIEESGDAQVIQSLAAKAPGLNITSFGAATPFRATTSR